MIDEKALARIGEELRDVPFANGEALARRAIVRYLELTQPTQHTTSTLHLQGEGEIDYKAANVELRRQLVELLQGAAMFPRCVSVTGGHRWNKPDDQGLQVCRTCALVRPVEVSDGRQPYEVFDFEKLGPRPGSLPLAGLETHGKQEREGSQRCGFVNSMGETTGGDRWKKQCALTAGHSGPHEPRRETLP